MSEMFITRISGTDPDEIAGYEAYQRERAEYVQLQILKGFVWGRSGFKVMDNEAFTINRQADYDAAGAFLEGYQDGLHQYLAMKRRMIA